MDLVGELVNILKQSKPSNDFSDHCLQVSGKLDHSKDSFLRNLLTQPQPLVQLSRLNFNLLPAPITIDTDSFGFDETRKKKPMKIVLKFDMKSKNIEVKKRKHDEESDQGRKRAK